MKAKQQPAAPAPSIAPTPGPGDNVRHALADISQAAASAGIARDVLEQKLRDFAANPNEDQIRALRGAVMLGRIASYIARKDHRMTATASDFGAAGIILAKSGPGAKTPSKAGTRTEDEARMETAARNWWFGLNIRAETSPTAGTGSGRSAGGQASAAKRKQRASKTVGAADVTIGGARVAAGSKSGPALPSQVPAGASPQDATAHVMSVASVLLAYAENKSNAKHLGGPACKVVKAAARSILALRMPT